MVAVNRYEDLAEPFLGEYPFDTLVPANKLVAFVQNLKDGHVIKADLLIGDPAKRFAACKRHLNQGGASPGLIEANRFVLVTHDATQKSSYVRHFADVADQVASGTLMRSVAGAMTPIKRSIKNIDAVHLDQLDPDERRRFEAHKIRVTAMATPLRDFYVEQINLEWQTAMAALGVPAAQAAAILRALPQFGNFQKMLRATEI